MKFLHAAPAVAASLLASGSRAQGLWPTPNVPVYSLPAMVQSFDKTTRTVELRLASGRVVRSELAWNCRFMFQGQSVSHTPEPGERLFVQSSEPDFSELSAVWDPLTFCAFGRRSHFSGEVRIPEPKSLEVTAGSRFTRRRRTVYRFELTPRTQVWIGGRRIASPSDLPPESELEVVADHDDTVFAVFDLASWRIFAATELRRTADRIAFLK